MNKLQWSLYLAKEKVASYKYNEHALKMFEKITNDSSRYYEANRYKNIMLINYAGVPPVGPYFIIYPDTNHSMNIRLTAIKSHAERIYYNFQSMFGLNIKIGEIEPGMKLIPISEYVKDGSITFPDRNLTDEERVDSDAITPAILG